MSVGVIKGDIMGIFLVFGIISILYLIDKALMAITAIIMTIYIIVKKAKKKKIGKIIILPIVILVILELLSLPADLFTINATIEAANYRKDIKINNYAVTENSESVEFEYNGKKYVNLGEYLTNVVGDGRDRVYLDTSENFKAVTTLTIKENIKEGIHWFFFNPYDKTVYALKDAPDQKILYSDFQEKVWCLKEELETAKQYYNDKSNYDYYIIYEKDGVKKQEKISLSVYNRILKCEEKNPNKDGVGFPSVCKVSEAVDIFAKSKDGRVLHEYICDELYMLDGKLYYDCESGATDLKVKLK
ncbi:MAG: hypothetical protein J6A78_06890 [Clostridia bacterium]|nr:hypothetical protein [Clostridia bacterium]